MQFKNLIQEIHRRSLWQVLGIYNVGVLRLDLIYDPLRDDPRFMALVGEN